MQRRAAGAGSAGDTRAHALGLERVDARRIIRADNDRELDSHRSRDSPRVDDRLSAA